MTILDNINRDIYTTGCEIACVMNDLVSKNPESCTFNESTLSVGLKLHRHQACEHNLVDIT